MSLAEAGSIETALHDSERDVLAVLLYAGQVPDAARGLSPDDFADTRWRAVFSAMLALDARGDATDASAVAVELTRRGDQQVRVERHDLLRLAGEASIPAALPTYVAHVREAAERRRWRQNATRLLQASDLGDIDSARAHARIAVQELTEAPTQRRAQLGARVLQRDRLAEIPEPRPRIEHTLDRLTVALLVGYTGTLKTFIGIDWGCAVQAGTRWQGRSSDPADVLLVVAEGATGLHQRIAAWEYAWNHGQPIGINVLPQPVQLLDRAQVHDLADLIRDNRYGFVILDTFARCFVGGEENSARDVGIAVDALYQLRDATDDGTVLAIHHTGKDRETTRGSSALEAGVDTVYRTDGDSRHVKLERTKRKDGPRDDVHHLRLDTTLDSAVVVSTNRVDIALELKASEQRLMSIIVDTFGNRSASKAELREVAKEHGIKSSGTFTRAINALVSTGALLEQGTDSRRRYRLPDVPADPPWNEATP